MNSQLDTSQVRVHCRSGSVAPLPVCDFVYVNAGATHPADTWLDALNPGGRPPLSPYPVARPRWNALANARDRR